MMNVVIHLLNYAIVIGLSCQELAAEEENKTSVLMKVMVQVPVQVWKKKKKRL